MNEQICPFSATLAKDVFGCSRAEQVIRRGGAEFACRDAAAHARCSRLHDCLKASALPALGLEDDLLQVPHGVLARIQFGGLLGLQRLLTGHSETVVSDIDSLVEAAQVRYTAIEAIPCDSLVDDITGYRLPRRRRR
ncbi:MAG: hypothetical protein R3308_01330 [Thiohalobacterales bacterium]|nr:hypothetical protein [Thiohalobacterales bacterium]